MELETQIFMDYTGTYPGSVKIVRPYSCFCWIQNNYKRGAFSNAQNEKRDKSRPVKAGGADFGGFGSGIRNRACLLFKPLDTLAAADRRDFKRAVHRRQSEYRDSGSVSEISDP